MPGQIQCLFTAIPTSGCLWNDVSCICQSEDLTRSMATCLLNNCTMADTQNTARAQADLCHLSKESMRTEMFLYSCILYAIGFINITLRTAGKIVSKRLAWDDWILVGALLFITLPLGCVLAMTRIGFGEHLWNLETGTLMPILRYCKFAFFILLQILFCNDRLTHLQFTLLGLPT
jgi:hypothetical protein